MLRQKKKQFWRNKSIATKVTGGRMKFIKTYLVLLNGNRVYFPRSETTFGRHVLVDAHMILYS